jgi:hypothetical protein
MCQQIEYRKNFTFRHTYITTIVAYRESNVVFPKISDSRYTRNTFRIRHETVSFNPSVGSAAVCMSEYGIKLSIYFSSRYPLCDTAPTKRIFNLKLTYVSETVANNNDYRASTGYPNRNSGYRIRPDP